MFLGVEKEWFGKKWVKVKQLTLIGKSTEKKKKRNA